MCPVLPRLPRRLPVILVLMSGCCLLTAVVPFQAAAAAMNKPAVKAKPGGGKAKKSAVETTTVAVGDPQGTSYRFEAEVQLAEGPWAMFRILTPNPQDAQSPAAGEVLLSNEGEILSVALHDPNGGKGARAAGAKYRYCRAYRPKTLRPAVAAAKAKKESKAKQEMSDADRQAAEAKQAKKAAEQALAEQRRAAAAKKLQDELAAAGREPHSANDHWIPVAIDIDGKSAGVWVEGCFVGNIALPARTHGAIAVVLTKGSQARNARVMPPRESLLVPIDLSAYANDHFSVPVGQARIEAGGIEFRLPGGLQNQVNLRPAQWLEWKGDGCPWAAEGYDGGAAIAFDPRMPRLRVPCVDYVAAHVLAVADDDPNLTATLKLRPRSHHARLALQWDYSAPVPRRSELAAGSVGVPPAPQTPAGGTPTLQTSAGGTPTLHTQAGGTPAPQAVDTPAGRLAHVVVPLGAIAQDLSIPQEYYKVPTEMMEIELTKEVHTAIIAPWACRFRYRPLGSPSGVRIAAITLEKAPLQMRVTSKETGHAFVEPGTPTFQVRLENITAKPQPYTLVARARHLDGTPTEVRASGSVAAGQSAEVAMELHVPKRGYYTLEMTVIDAAKRELTRRTSFALLPPAETRKHRDQSPFGTSITAARPTGCRTVTRCSAPCTSNWACATACVSPAKFVRSMACCTAMSRTSPTRTATRRPSRGKKRSLAIPNTRPT